MLAVRSCSGVLAWHYKGTFKLRQVTVMFSLPAGVKRILPLNINMFSLSHVSGKDADEMGIVDIQCLRTLPVNDAAHFAQQVAWLDWFLDEIIHSIQYSTLQHDIFCVSA